jgi:hypothetical protein
MTAFLVLLRSVAASALPVSTSAFAQSSADTDWVATGPVTVVVEVSLAANATSAEALVALNDIRALMKKQPGYISEEFLRNLNAANVPRFLHVSRWASMHS